MFATTLGQQTSSLPTCFPPCRGELLRASVAEGRERRYRAQVVCPLSLLAICYTPAVLHACMCTQRHVAAAAQAKQRCSKAGPPPAG